MACSDQGKAYVAECAVKESEAGIRTKSLLPVSLLLQNFHLACCHKLWPGTTTSLHHAATHLDFEHRGSLGLPIASSVFSWSL